MSDNKPKYRSPWNIPLTPELLVEWGIHQSAVPEQPVVDSYPTTEYKNLIKSSIPHSGSELGEPFILFMLQLEDTFNDPNFQNVLFVLHSPYLNPVGGIGTIELMQWNLIIKACDDIELKTPLPVFGCNALAWMTSLKAAYINNDTKAALNLTNPNMLSGCLVHFEQCITGLDIFKDILIQLGEETSFIWNDIVAETQKDYQKLTDQFNSAK